MPVFSNNSGYFEKHGPQRCGRIDEKGTGEAVKHLRKAWELFEGHGFS